MIQNCVFDFGRVLVGFDVHRLYDPLFGGDRDKVEWFGRHVIAEPWVRRLDIGEPFDRCVHDLQLQFPAYADAIAAYDVRYQDMVGEELEGMRDLLLSLRHKGFRLYGLTNWSYKVYDVMRTHGIFSLLDGALISSEVHLLKPDVRIYESFLSRFDLRGEECVFVDDRTENVEGALKAGFGAAFRFSDAKRLRADLHTIMEF